MLSRIRPFRVSDQSQHHLFLQKKNRWAAITVCLGSCSASAGTAPLREARKDRPRLRLSRPGDLELAQQADRRRPDHRLQRLEARRPRGIAGVGRNHRRRRGVHLDLLLHCRAPRQEAENGKNLDSLENHFDPQKLRYDFRTNYRFLEMTQYAVRTIWIIDENMPRFDPRV